MSNSKSKYGGLVVTSGPDMTPEYRCWISIKGRCHNPNNDSYGKYGARGIRVCDEWMNDFPAFYAHIGQRPTPKHSIDRIDGTGNYAPGNVRWATAKEQALNRPLYAHDIEFNGMKKNLTDWASYLGISRKTLYQRLENPNWSFEEAMSTPNQRELIRNRADDTECECPRHGTWIAADDVQRLVRELDVAINGEAGAARQASLCDIVGQVKRDGLTAQPPAAPATTGARAEAVAWRTRANDGVPWNITADESQLSAPRRVGHEIQPLFTAPPEVTHGAAIGGDEQIWIAAITSYSGHVAAQKIKDAVHRARATASTRPDGGDVGRDAK